MAEPIITERLDEEWRTFELYEKVRLREHRKRLLFFVTTLLVFLSLCAVPVVDERLPKWKSLSAARHLSIEIEKLKTLAIKTKKPAKLSFLENGEYKVETLEHCEDAIGNIVSLTRWTSTSPEHALHALTPDEAKAFEVKLAVDQVCFDPVFGVEQIKSKKVIINDPVKDLAEKRLDRASYIILQGDSAEITIN
jgi:hypothetical protein